MVISYPEYIWISYPKEEWEQGVPIKIEMITHPKSECLVVLLYHKKHFAIMELNLSKQQLFVYDGLDVARNK
jgi:hypothetical protein